MSVTSLPERLGDRRDDGLGVDAVYVADRGLEIRVPGEVLDVDERERRVVRQARDPRVAERVKHDLAVSRHRQARPLARLAEGPVNVGPVARLAVAVREDEARAVRRSSVSAWLSYKHSSGADPSGQGPWVHGRKSHLERPPFPCKSRHVPAALTQKGDMSMRRFVIVLALLSLCTLAAVASSQAEGDIMAADCVDGLDNDGDDWIDAIDPGCQVQPGKDPGLIEFDNDESNPPPPPEWFIEGEIPGDGDGDPSDETGSVCRQKELKRSMSETGPWGRRLFLLTTWCYEGGIIKSSRSTARTSHDLFCENVSPPTVARTAGGAGSLFVEIQANVEVACASIPTNWPKYHDTLMMRIRYRANGTYQRVAYD